MPEVMEGDLRQTRTLQELILGEQPTQDRAERREEGGGAGHDAEARPRSHSGKTALTMASVVGNISAAPTPWVARTAMSQGMSCAAPAIAEWAINSSAPARKTRLSPS